MNINKEQINDYLQNKNIVMFALSFVFMSGIMAYFSLFPVLFAAICTSILILLMLFDILGIKKVFVLIAVFYFGFFLTFAKIKTGDDLLPLAPANLHFTGRIENIPTCINGKAKFIMNIEKAENKSVNGKTFVFMSGNKLSKLNIGEKITLYGSLRKPFSASNPSQFDYGSYLKNYNIFTVLYSEDDDFKIVKSKMSLKWKFLQKLNNTRRRIISTHSKYLKSPNLEILGGIVFGQDAVAPPDNIKSSFINSGLLHILAASGMNVGFIFSFWVVILEFFRVPFKPRTISGIFIIVLYTLMTGLGAAVIRAALMLIFVLIGKLFDRDAHSVSLLSLVAVLMLIYNPAYINDVSFQLSFLVTLGLVTTLNIISSKIENIPDKLKMAILIPLVAQIWISPIQMFYFNTFSIYSILANICSVIIVSVISFAGFISSIISVIPRFADITCMYFDFFTNYLLNILIWISDFFSNLPHCIIQTSHPNIAQIFLYYFMLIAVSYLIKYDKFKQAFVTFLCVCSILAVTNIKIVSKDLEIITFDVGNADSFMIKTPKNKYFFIDTGKAPYKSGNSEAKLIMLKYLKDRGIKDIEGLIVTHFDSDHSGGTCDFIKETKVKNLYLNTKSRETQTAKEIFKTIKQNNQKYSIVRNNAVVYSEPNLKLTTFKTNIGKKNKSNDSSTITLLTYKNFDMLFMADGGIETFESLKRYIPHNVEVLKVGHHGAAGVVNENMLVHLRNRVSIISTGLNYYGHPNKGTLDVLRNTDILRTDKLNSIKISTDGNKYKVYSFNTGDRKYNLKESYYSK